MIAAALAATGVDYDSMNVQAACLLKGPQAAQSNGRCVIQIIVGLASAQHMGVGSLCMPVLTV